MSLLYSECDLLPHPARHARSSRKTPHTFTIKLPASTPPKPTALATSGWKRHAPTEQKASDSDCASARYGCCSLGASAHLSLVLSNKPVLLRFQLGLQLLVQTTQLRCFLTLLLQPSSGVVEVGDQWAIRVTGCRCVLRSLPGEKLPAHCGISIRVRRMSQVPVGKVPAGSENSRP